MTTQTPVDQPTQSNGDLSPAPGQATNEDSREAVEKRNKAVALNAMIANAARDVNDANARLWWLLQESKTQQSWKYALDGEGNAYKSWKLFIAGVCGEGLKSWAAGPRNAFIRTLSDDNFTGAEIADMTGVSEATVSRVVAGQDVGEGSPAGAASGRAGTATSATEKFVKQIDTLVGKISDADRYSTPDLRDKVAVDLVRALSATLAEVRRRGARVRPEHVQLANMLHAMAGTDGASHASSAEGQQPRSGTQAKPGQRVA